MAVVLGVLPAALVTAQDWSELNTLSFTPVVSERAIADGTAETARNLPGQDSARDEPPAERVIARIQAAVAMIEAELADNGAYSPDLIPLYRTLADIYLEIDGYGDAIDMLEQAQQVVRRNQGLYSLDQADLIEGMIEIEMAITPSEQSIERETDLRELVQRNPDDARNVGILTRMAGRQMDVVDYLLINGIVPELTLNVSAVNRLAPFRSAPTASSMAASMLRRSRSSYRAAMRAALSDEQAEISQLFELEDNLIDSFYYELMNPKLRRGTGVYFGRAGSLYSGGAGVLGAQLTNIQRFSRTPEAVAAAMIEIADWHLMFGSFGRAMGDYQEALAYLRAESGDEERVAAVFSPARPVPLPAFVPNANVYDDLSNVRGYFDVEIEINRFGGVRDVNVIGQSGNATAAIERRLRRFVYQSRFRPRYMDGQWQSSDRFVLRYEFGYRTS